MKRFDFLLTYEIKNREIESICLLKRELERRGYSVRICEQYRSFFEHTEPVEAGVIVIPAYYRERAKFYTASHASKVKKIVNMQWEQITTSSRSKKDGLAAIKPWGYDAMHIAWGKDDYMRLTKVYGVPKKHVSLAGHIGMDFLRKELRGYYLSKKEMYERFSIPQGKELCLFISSFTLTDITERVFETAATNEEEKYTLKLYQQESIDSYKIIIRWIKKMLAEYPDRIFVYRPHPEERNDAVLKSLQDEYSNFRVISEMSVKQWILVASKIITWRSTSIAEIFFANKECLVLQPIPFSEKTLMQIYKNGSSITTYEDFAKKMDDTENSFPIPEEDIRKYYCNSNEKMTYEIICDTLEQVLSDDSFTLDNPLEYPFKGLFNKERVKNWLKRSVARSKLCQWIREKDKMKGTTIRKNIDDIFYVKEKLEKNHVSDKEINAITIRIDEALKEAGK